MIAENINKLVKEKFTIKNLENEMSVIISELNKEKVAIKSYNLQFYKARL